MRFRRRSVTTFLCYCCCCCWVLLLLLATNVFVVVVVTCSSIGSSSSSSSSSDYIRFMTDEIKNQLQLLRQRQQQQQLDDNQNTITSYFSGVNIYYGIPRTVLDRNFQRSGDSINDINDINNEKQKQKNNYDDPKRKYYDEYETIGKDVEKWALKMIREETTTTNNDNDNGWTEIFCSKAFCHKFNTNHNNNNNNTSTSTSTSTRQYIKWIPDSRDRKHQGDVVDLNNHNQNQNNSNQNQNNSNLQKHPCMKLIATINAPYPIVCRYLSERNRFKEYNSLLIDQKDIEILNSYSKICWSQSKKLLFIQPRDFVTYCRHRWLNNGRVQFITNQACEHISCDNDDNDNTASDNNDNDNNNNNSNNNKYRAYSLRGATLISRSKEYPNDQRTKIIMLSHCNCGKDIPEWAVRTAVGILAPIKPFEIINRIEMGIQHSRSDLDKAEAEAEKEKEEATMKAIKEEPASSSSAAASNVERGGGGRRTIRRSTRPAGIAQMGYGAFWPDGGGLLEEEEEEEEDTPYYDETI